MCDVLSFVLARQNQQGVAGRICGLWFDWVRLDPIGLEWVHNWLIVYGSWFMVHVLCSMIYGGSCNLGLGLGLGLGLNLGCFMFYD